jgi:hypothetical protein
MYQASFEPMFPVFERAKMVHALDSESTVSGKHKSLGLCKYIYEFVHIGHVYTIT